MTDSIDRINYRLDEQDKQLSRLRNNAHDTNNNFIKLSQSQLVANKSIEEVYLQSMFTHDKLIGIEPRLHTLELDSVRKSDFESRIREILKDCQEGVKKDKGGLTIPSKYWPPIAVVISCMIYSINWEKFSYILDVLPH